MAALAWFAGPGPAGDIVAKIPAPTILRIARILLDSQEFALLAGFARHVSAGALRATVEELCGLELLRLAGKLDPPDIVNAIARQLTDRHIEAAIAAVPTADPWPSFSDLIDAFDVELRERLLDRLIHAPAAVPTRWREQWPRSWYPMWKPISSPRPSLPATYSTRTVACRSTQVRQIERYSSVTNTSGPYSSYFERVGEHRFAPTIHARGAWAVDEQHFSPLGGLIVHEVERMRARHRRAGLLISRIGFDILGRNTFEEFDVHVEVLRPGRTIELVGATVVIAGRITVSARIWLMSTEDTGSVAGGEPEGLPAPETLCSWPLTSVWPGGYVASLETRPIGIPQPGRTAAWLSAPHVLVAGERASDLASFVALVDTANGIAVRQEPTKWMFPNLDLTIHLYRQPEAGWTGLDTTVTFGHSGQGLTSTVLHDVRGPVGYAQQILTVRPRPGHSR